MRLDGKVDVSREYYEERLDHERNGRGNDVTEREKGRKVGMRREFLNSEILEPILVFCRRPRT